MAILLWLDEASWHVWNLEWGHWSVADLPLHICSLLIWLAGFILIFAINLLLGTDFLYITSKPTTASLLDTLPRWPYYLIDMELIRLAIFLLLYLPFIIRDGCARAKVRTT